MSASAVPAKCCRPSHGKLTVAAFVAMAQSFAWAGVKRLGVTRGYWRSDVWNDSLSISNDRRLADPLVMPADIVLPQGSVQLEVVDGHCGRVNGPLLEAVPGPSHGSKAEQSLGLWRHDTQHLLCFVHNAGTNVHFVVNKLGNGKDGEFGFGPGIGVSLRPNIETRALWPLQAGVESLGLPVETQRGFLTLALRVTFAGDIISDLPIVVARLRNPLVDVQILDRRQGTCFPDRNNGDRFLCRANKKYAGASPVVLLLFCEGCLGQEMESWSLSLARLRGPEANEANTLPWLSWSAEVPEEGSVQWIVKLRLGSEVRHFEVALIQGDGDVFWSSNESSYERLFMFVMGLKLIAIIACLLLLLGLGLSARSFPAPVAAAMPSLLASLLALQFMVLMNSGEAETDLFSRSLQPFTWLAPTVSTCMLIAASVLTLHFFAVVRFLVENGEGSAAFLPHGLFFGAWELRLLPFIVMPLAAGSSAAVAGALAGEAAPVQGVLHSALLIGIASLGITTWQKIQSFLHEERVICMRLAATERFIFMDRVCDQLRAMPFVLGHSGLLGTWSASPGWHYSPAAASILEVEHSGGPEELHDRGGAWHAGPWSTRQRHVDTNQRSASRRLESTAVMEHHPVHVTAKFAYAASKSSDHIAGIVAVPWLDVAIPASELLLLEAWLVGGANLSVQACQLSGPLTSGRFAACFDWSDRHSWRWSADFLLRVVLGVYAGLSSGKAHDGTWLESWHAEILLAGLLVAVAFAVLYVQPHTHAVDNIILSASLASAALAMCPSGLAEHAEHNGFEHIKSSSLWIIILLASLPLFATLTCCLMVVLNALHWKGQGLHAMVLPKVVPGWAESLQHNGQLMKGAYSGLLGGDSTHDFQAADSVTQSNHDVDAVLLGDMFVDEALRSLTLPAKLRSKVAHTILTRGGINASVLAGTSDVSRRPRIAMPRVLLFPDGTSRMNERSVLPFASLLSDDDGLLLYQDKELNGGIHWKQALGSFFHADNDSAVLREAERVLVAHLEQGSHGAASERALAIIEVISDV